MVLLAFNALVAQSMHLTERQRLLLDAEVTKQIIRRGDAEDQADPLTSPFYRFVREGWHWCGEPAPFCDGPHLRAMAIALELQTYRLIGDLVINVPPGHCKSRMVNVFWPAFVWGEVDVARRWLFTGYDLRVSLRDARWFHRLVTSPMYQAMYPHVRITSTAPALGEMYNTEGGSRLAIQLGGGLTGHHGHNIVIDDPIKPDEAAAMSGLQIEQVWQTITGTLSSRVADPKIHRNTMIMQRLNEDDPAGKALRELKWEHLNLPMHFVPDCDWTHGELTAQLDVRTEEGQLLWPNRWTPEALESAKRGLGGPAVVSAQWQQNPTPKSGSFFEQDWFREYDTLPPVWSLIWLQSWDLGFKGRQGARSQLEVEARSRVHGALWAYDPRTVRLYLIDERIGRWNYAETKRVFQECQHADRWNLASTILVEDKANGPALISELRPICPAIKPWEPYGSKEDRARRHSARVESGVLWLPRTAAGQLEPWALDFRTELVRFPRQKANDRVDTTTMLLDFVFSPGMIAAAQLESLQLD